MNTRAFVATAILSILPAASWAQLVTGLYVGAGAGGNFMQSETTDYSFRDNPFTYRFGAFSQSVPGNSGSGRFSTSYDPGAAAVGSIGFGFGNGLRVEGEGNYRYNPASNAFGNDQQKYGAMANLLYDFRVGSPDIFPYVGLGAGYEWTDRGFHVGRTNAFAYQAIIGVATPIAFVPGLSLTLEYRFLGLAGTRRNEEFAAGTYSGGEEDTLKFSDNYNHSILLGARYAFNHPAPAPVVPEPAPQPPAQAARTYLVFFDWDRSDLTDRARQIVAEAAQASTRIATTRIEVQGNADSSGTHSYNQGLSLRRAQTVAAELVRDGVSRTAIDIEAFGDTKPLVASAPGAREPQNRRVAIILR